MCASGSPPPARRALAPRCGHRRGQRLTSARAERTRADPRCRGRAAVHLRLRGEHPAEVEVTYVHGGPPPLARRARGARRPGTEARRPTSACRRGRLREPQLILLLRFTSACAESTWARRASACDRVAHLRLRGEDSSPIVNRGRVTGSPPPARRGLPGKDTTSGELRFTSACAERSRVRKSLGCCSAVYLRLSGEVHVSPGAIRLVVGLPPPERRGPFATCGVRSALPIRDSRNAGHAPA